MPDTIGHEAAIPNPALQPLSFLIGEWSTEGSHAQLPGKTLHGRTSFRWSDGGAFLVMRSEIDEPEIPSGQILLKAVGVAPLPNYTRDVKQGIARWDAYVDVPDPDALAAEFASRHVEFSEPLKDTHDGLRGFEQVPSSTLPNTWRHS